MSPLRVNDDAIFDGIAVEVDYSVCTECGGKVDEGGYFQRYLAHYSHATGAFLFNRCEPCSEAADRDRDELWDSFLEVKE